VASAITAKVIAEEVRKGCSLENAIQKSHQQILAAAERGEGARGMGSTVVAICQPEPGRWELGWVGDSRAYLWTQTSDDTGELQQISRDHSYVQALFDSGAITAEEMDHHPERNVITQCLGSLEISTVHVDQLEGEWKPGQKIILCSDGLSDEVDDSEIASILNESPDRATAVEQLLSAALKHGGRDNVTVVLIEAPVPESNHGTPAPATTVEPSSSYPTSLPAPESKARVLAETLAAVFAACALAAVLVYFFG